MPELSRESCFHEASNPQPHQKVFWGVAVKFAYALVGHHPEGAAHAVAREAFQRVMQREPPTRWPPAYDLHRAMGRRPNQASLEYAHMVADARRVDLQLAWNRARPRMLSVGGRWVNYDADPVFVDWIDRLHWKWRLRFQNRHLPLGRGIGHGLTITELAPMPEGILRSYFKSRLWQPRTSEEGSLTGVPAQLVAQTCERLLAYHSARCAVYGQQHVVRLLRLLHKRRGHLEGTWWPITCFDGVVDGPLIVESARPEVWLQRFVPEARKVVEKATIAMANPETAWRRLKRLLPNRFCVQQTCGRCGVNVGTRVQAIEAQLPPFGPRCFCRVGWSSSRVHELQRRLEIWAFEVALLPNTPAPFPVIDFLSRGGELHWFSSYCDVPDC